MATYTIPADWADIHEQLVLSATGFNPRAHDQLATSRFVCLKTKVWPRARMIN